MGSHGSRAPRSRPQTDRANGDAPTRNGSPAGGGYAIVRMPGEWFRQDMRASCAAEPGHRQKAARHEQTGRRSRPLPGVHHGSAGPGDRAWENGPRRGGGQGEQAASSAHLDPWDGVHGPGAGTAGHPVSQAERPDRGKLWLHRIPPNKRGPKPINHTRDRKLMQIGSIIALRPESLAALKDGSPQTRLVRHQRRGVEGVVAWAPPPEAGGPRLREPARLHDRL